MILQSIVLKIGGSLLYDDKLQIKETFILKLKDWYLKNKNRYKKIVIVVGGGKLSRFIGGQAIKFFYEANDVHGLAMQGTQMNAQLIKGILEGAENDIRTPENLVQALEFAKDKNIKTIVTGGVKEGWSTDMDAAIFTDALGLKRFYKLSNVSNIYSADPKLDDKAIAFSELSWKEYCEIFKIVDDTAHIPNANLPIDPICTKFCMNKGLSVFISGGSTIEEYKDLSNVFELGTYLHP